MSKITLDREMFKALASETRLNILKTLDGKNLGLNEISSQINLNKATLHEHLSKLHKAGLVKRNEREGHKWVYYKLSWKGETLLHPENTKIVVMFSIAFISLFIGIANITNFLKTQIYIKTRSELTYSPNIIDINDKLFQTNKDTYLITDENIFIAISIIFLIMFIILLLISIWKYNKNKKFSV
jgi:DNA-binding transcriptional ArsR family regulator